MVLWLNQLPIKRISRSFSRGRSVGDWIWPLRLQLRLRKCGSMVCVCTPTISRHGVDCSFTFLLLS